MQECTEFFTRDLHIIRQSDSFNMKRNPANPSPSIIFRLFFPRARSIDLTWISGTVCMGQISC